MTLARYALGAPLWSFEPWNGSLFSRDARPGDRLGQYARVFNAVEGNTTFYSAPSARTVARWLAETPPDFRFSFKLPREITHDGLLLDAKAPLEAFLRAIEPLRERCGPILLQLPPNFGPDRLRDLEAFLECAPREFEWAVELRHRDYFYDAALAGHADELLSERGCDRVVMDTRALRAGNPNHPEVLAALHKKPDLPVRPEPVGRRPMVRFVGHPDDEANEPYLEEWAERVAGWIDDGLDPIFFVHTASNLRTPEVARDFHARVAPRTKQDLGELPPFPGESGEQANGQLELL